MDDLVQFLRDRLAEDEQTARAAGDGWYGYDPEQQIAFVPPEDSRHIARHDPARVLREVEAKRRILDEVVPEVEKAEEMIEDEWHTSTDAADDLIRLLALPYADHPDYQDTWRP
ncbi:DUF6221 family protein [Streptomyces griseus]|uniref:DUF6221 family protein n=1 Tax=Streptomyces griseus TaxID=1911 RepID=UPI00379F8A77